MQLGNKTLSLPLIQGGMGIGVSLSQLAGNVAKQGGMGVISTANSGYRESDFQKDPASANLRSLKEEIKKAKEIANGNGIVAVNAMVAASDYATAVKNAIDSGIDAVISGAGLPLKLPEIAGDADVLLAPIVSSGRAAALICRTWQKRCNRLPDFIVIEGYQAGGHLGFSLEELQNNTAKSLDVLFDEVKESIVPFGDIPIFVAGSVTTPQQLVYWTDKGAAGVQIATPFIATYECDASEGYKQVILNAEKDDVLIIKSPVGMPGRAVRSPLTSLVENGGRISPKSCFGCIASCRPATTPYCITQALIDAVKGKWETGLFFCGENVGDVTEIKTVKALVEELTSVWRSK